MLHNLVPSVEPPRPRILEPRFMPILVRWNVAPASRVIRVGMRLAAGFVPRRDRFPPERSFSGISGAGQTGGGQTMGDVSGLKDALQRVAGQA